MIGLHLPAAKNPDRSRPHRPEVPGRLIGGSEPKSGRVQRLPAYRRPGLQAQVREDALDHQRVQDGGDDLELAAAVRAVL